MRLILPNIIIHPIEKYQQKLLVPPKNLRQNGLYKRFDWSTHFTNNFTTTTTTQDKWLEKLFTFK